MYSSLEVWFVVSTTNGKKWEKDRPKLSMKKYPETVISNSILVLKICFFFLCLTLSGCLSLWSGEHFTNVNSTYIVFISLHVSSWCIAFTSVQTLQALFAALSNDMRLAVEKTHIPACIQTHRYSKPGNVSLIVAIGRG